MAWAGVPTAREHPTTARGTSRPERGSGGGTSGRGRGRPCGAVAHLRGAERYFRTRSRLAPQCEDRSCDAVQPILLRHTISRPTQCRERQARLGGFTPPSYHATRGSVFPLRRPSVRRSSDGPSDILVAEEPATKGDQLGLRHRNGLALDRLGLDPTPAGQDARDRADIRSQSGISSPVARASVMDFNVPEPLLFGQQSCNRGDGGTACRRCGFSNVRRE